MTTLGQPLQGHEAIRLPPLEHLPDSGREIADLIGMDGLACLVAHYGGTPLSIPKQMSPDWEPGRRLGEDVSQRLVRAFPGERLTVPLLNTGYRAKRNAEILEAHTGGQSAKEIAKRFGIHVRSVHRVIAAAREERA